MKTTFWLFIAAAVALPCCLAGCKNKERDQYTLRVRFPSGAAIKQASPVDIDGIEAGSVSAVVSEQDSVVAVAAINGKDLIQARLKPGIRATLRSDGGVSINSSEINPGDASLASGTTVIGRSRIEEVIRKYATWSTAATAGGCLAVILLLLKLLKTVIRMGVVVLVLCLSAGLGIVVTPTVGRFLEADVYPRLQAAASGQPVSMNDPRSQRTSVGPEGEAGDRQGSLQVHDLEKTIEKVIGLPKPSWAAFFLCWLLFFVLLLIAVRLLYRLINVDARAAVQR